MTEQRTGSDDPVVGSDRVLAVLKLLAGFPDGASLNDLTQLMASPKATIHRALAALVRAGFAANDGTGQYRLGDEFVRLAFGFHEANPDTVRIRPILEALAALFKETSHYAVLDGRDVVYRAKVDPPSGAVRLTSVVGGRNPAHVTAVGKLLLSQTLTTPAAVRNWVGPLGLERRTDRTIHTPAALFDELATIREQGYAVDDQESEPGINCVALPVYLSSPTRPSGAVSVSALAYRTPLAAMLEKLPEMRSVVGIGD